MPQSYRRASLISIFTQSLMMFLVDKRNAVSAQHVNQNSDCEYTKVIAGDCIGCYSSYELNFDHCNQVSIQSCKELSNVVIEYDNCNEIKYDNLSGHSKTITAPNGARIVSVWVKAGCYQSGDGPGYGYHFTNPNNCGVANCESVIPSLAPTSLPSYSPSYSPTSSPTNSPSVSPTLSPTDNPTKSPTLSPTDSPTQRPTDVPSLSPTLPPYTIVTGGICKGCDASNDLTFYNCDKVLVESCKDLSNVVLEYNDCTQIKYDNLSGKVQTFIAPADKTILNVWVKSGCYKSNDGPGYGRHFSNPNECPQIDCDSNKTNANLAKNKGKNLRYEK